MPDEMTLEEMFSNTITNYIQQKEIGFKYSIIKEPKLSEYTTSNTPIRLRPDFIILKGPYPYIIAEVVQSSKFNQNDYLEQFQNYRVVLDLIGADYLVITDMDNFVVITNDEQATKLTPFKKFFELFDEELTKNEIDQLKFKISHIIKQTIQDSEFNQLKYIFTSSSLRGNNFLENIIEYNTQGRFFHFKISEDILNSFENLFFKFLLDPVQNNIVCRYTTLDTLYHTLNNKSYRMASHIAMNDRGEVDYVDKYIGAFYTPLLSMTLLEIKKLNDSYISSCTVSEKSDDLTMYRLYGDDTKGVCLHFETEDKIHRDFLIKKISYAKAPDDHPELELIKKIVAAIHSTYKLRFRFMYIDIWKHFFKSFDYAVESEVRLLYIDKDRTPSLHKSKGWVIAQPDNILSKFVMFNLEMEKFPLKLKKIILGPNCYENSVNKRQLELLLSEIGMPHVEVETSKIESYRKS